MLFPLFGSFVLRAILHRWLVYITCYSFVMTRSESALLAILDSLRECCYSSPLARSDLLHVSCLLAHSHTVLLFFSGSLTTSTLRDCWLATLALCYSMRLVNLSVVICRSVWFARKYCSSKLMALSWMLLFSSVESLAQNTCPSWWFA